jgi:GNAT superfamily N-acetyltransferase
MKIVSERKDDFIITTDKSKMDVAFIHRFLSTQSYWSPDIPFEKVNAAVDNSLNFGLFHHEKQIGYARVVSDYCLIAYLGDVFVIPDYRGKGLSKWMMEKIIAHPDLQNLRRWILLTRDAHELYKKYGWKTIAAPERWMEIHNPDAYL